MMLSHAEDRATHQTAVADAGAIKALVRIMNRPPPPASSGISADSRRYAEAQAAASHDLARRAADALAKLVQDRDAYQMKVRDEDGVSTLRALLDRRDPKVQRAAAAALLAMGEHERLVKEIERNTETLVARPDADRARDALKSAVRTLAELAKEGANATAEGDMVDAVVRSGAVEAIVPLLSLSQRVGEEFDVSFGDIEKEASYAISLMASRDANQNRIAEAGALPGLVALLQRYPPQTTGSVPTSVARRAADAVTNLAHENNGIKNQVRVEGASRRRIAPGDEGPEGEARRRERPAHAGVQKRRQQKPDRRMRGVTDAHLYGQVGGPADPLRGGWRDRQPRALLDAHQAARAGRGRAAARHRAPELGVPGVAARGGAAARAVRHHGLVQGEDGPARRRAPADPDAGQLGRAAPRDGGVRARRLAQDADNQVGILHAAGLRPLLDLLDCDKGNLQHNAGVRAVWPRGQRGQRTGHRSRGHACSG